MGKGRQKRRGHASQAPEPKPVAVLETTTAIASDPTLSYKLCVLLYDFLNVTRDPDAQRRINVTTDEHYISLPYFSPDEAAMVKSAIVDTHLDRQVMRGLLPDAYDDDAYERGMTREEERADDVGSVMDTLENKTFDGVVRTLMSNFLDKRRASGDARPCGPHHLAPLYASLFGLDLDKTRDDKFLGRLRRSGLTMT